MLRDTINEVRTEAKAAGIPWAWVVARKNELVEAAIACRERHVGARITAWHSHVGPTSGSSPFWRHGFRARFGKRLARGSDYTIIPGYDEIADYVRYEFPEWTDTGELWEFLLSDYEPMPPRENFYWEALADMTDLAKNSTHSMSTSEEAF